MDNTFAQSVAHWQNFYILAGGAAATLTGLLFVAVSLHIDLFSNASELRVRDLAVETLLNFASILVISLVMTSADASPLEIGIPLIALGVYQAYRTATTSVKSYRESPKQMPRRRLLRFASWQIAKLLSWVLLFCIACTLLSGDVTKLYWLVWTVIPILLMATSSAWNMMIRLGEYKKHRATNQASGSTTNP